MNTEADRIQKAYEGKTMTESTETTETTETTEGPTVTIKVAAILPIENEDDTKVGFLLMADGSVRWSVLEENNDA
jgi:hypothetical protein